MCLLKPTELNICSKMTVGKLDSLTLKFLHLQALPESLRYLLAAGQNEKAAHVVKLMAASNGKVPPSGHLIASAEVL